MPDIRISELPTAPEPVTGAELVPIVQNGQTVKTTVSELVSAPNQTQTFLTVNRETTLPNSRYLSVGTGMGLDDTGSQGKLEIVLNGASGSLEVAQTGLIAKNNANSVVSRALVFTGTGLSITNADGVNGDPTLQFTGLVYQLANTSGSGLLVNANGTLTPREVVGVANQTAVTNGNGVLGSPTVGLAENPVLPGAGGVTLPAGPEADRPVVAVNGTIRYNTDISQFEVYQNDAWVTLGTGSGSVTNVSGYPNQIVVTNGSTTPQVKIAADPVIDGVGGMVIPKGDTSQRGDSIAGNLRYNTELNAFEGYVDTEWKELSTGGVGVTSVDTGFGLVGGPITTTGTIAIDTANVATPGNTMTFTNKTISGNNNTITNIGNASLTNHSITLGTDLVELGATLTQLNGMTINGNTNIVTNLANDSLQYPYIRLGTTQVNLGSTANVLQNLTSISLTQSPEFGNQVATKAYVDNMVSTGFTIHDPVSNYTKVNIPANYTQGGTAPQWESIADGKTLTSATPHGLFVNDVIVFQDSVNGLEAGYPYFVYSAGATSITLSRNYQGIEVQDLTDGTGLSINSRANSGVGATLTAVDNGPLVMFGTTINVGERVIFEAQTDASHNGVYVLTQAGSPTTPWIATRATDADTYVPSSETALSAGAYFLVTGGIHAGDAYIMSTLGVIDFGVTPIEFTQFSQTVVYTAGTGLQLIDSQFSIADTGVIAGVYDSASKVPSISVNAQGQLYGIAQVDIAINANQITTGVLATNRGGTGLSSFNLNGALYATSTSALTTGTLPVVAGGTGVTTSTGSGSNVLSISPVLVTPDLGTPSAAVLTNATGLPLTTGVTGVLPVINGGTGTTTSTGTGSLVLNTSPTLVTPNLGRPSNVDLANGFNMPLSGVTGVLAIANGGTNTTDEPTLGSVAYGKGDRIGYTVAGLDGQILTARTSGEPYWADPFDIGVSSFSAGDTGFTPNEPTGGDITLAGVLKTTHGGTGLTVVGTAGQVLTSNGTSLEWTTPSAIGVTSFSGGTTGLLPSVATKGDVTLSGILNVLNGGTGLNGVGTGQIPFGNGSDPLDTDSNFYYDFTQLYVPQVNITSGNLTISERDSFARIFADFTADIDAMRLQNILPNTNTDVGISPNGTATESYVTTYNSNGAGQKLSLGITASKAVLRSSNVNGAPYFPITINTNNTDQFVFNNDGSLQFLTSGARIRGDMNNANPALRLAFQNSGTGDDTRLTVLPKGATGTSAFTLYDTADTQNAQFLGFSINALGAYIQTGVTGTAQYKDLRFALGLEDDVVFTKDSNVLIGNVTPTAGLTNTLWVKNGIYGNLTGNVTGNLTGNVTGNVSGSAGSCTGNSATATSLAGGSANAIPYQSATGVTAYVNAGVAGQVLASGGPSSPPVWANLGNPITRFLWAIWRTGTQPGALGGSAKFSPSTGEGILLTDNGANQFGTYSWNLPAITYTAAEWTLTASMAAWKPATEGADQFGVFIGATAVPTNTTTLESAASGIVVMADFYNERWLLTVGGITFNYPFLPLGTTRPSDVPTYTNGASPAFNNLEVHVYTYEGFRTLEVLWGGAVQFVFDLVNYNPPGTRFGAVGYTGAITAFTGVRYIKISY